MPSKIEGRPSFLAAATAVATPLGAATLAPPARTIRSPACKPLSPASDESLTPSTTAPLWSDGTLKRCREPWSSAPRVRPSTCGCCATGASGAISWPSGPLFWLAPSCCSDGRVPDRTSISCGLPSRSTVRCRVSPLCDWATRRVSSVFEPTSWPFSPITTSPGLTPALSAGPQLCGEVLGQIGGKGEADADRATRRGEDLGIDPDHPAVDVEGRAAGIAAIDRGVDLDEVDEAVADVAAIGRDDAGGGRIAQPIGIADGD